MNYIAEIRAFYDWKQTNKLTADAQALWHTLMHINNKCAVCIDGEWLWRVEFRVSNQTLLSYLEFSRTQLDRMRNDLIQRGRIRYRKGKGNQCGTYQMIPFNTQYVAQTVTQPGTQTGTQLWRKQVLLNNNNLTPSSIERSCASHPRFVPPTLDEVRAYCLERKNQIDPTAFVDYYQARGWKLSSGQAMRDWRAAVRTWEKRERPSGWGKPTKPSAPADFQPSSERIQKSGEWLDQFLASQEQETHHQLQEDHKKEPPSNDRETACPMWH